MLQVEGGILAKEAEINILEGVGSITGFRLTSIDLASHGGAPNNLCFC
jgi:hypothetical protein